MHLRQFIVVNLFLVVFPLCFLRSKHLLLYLFPLFPAFFYCLSFFSPFSHAILICCISRDHTLTFFFSLVTLILFFIFFHFLSSFFTVFVFFRRFHLLF